MSGQDKTLQQAINDGNFSVCVPPPLPPPPILSTYNLNGQLINEDNVIYSAGFGSYGWRYSLSITCNVVKV